ncbi:MAG: hypothetical protein R3B82_11180 [Sandaracinaceae bacterium]
MALTPALLLVAALASAQDAAESRYEGHFVLEGSADAARDRVRRALRPALAQVPSMFRSMAEERLAGRFQIVRAIDIALPGDRIRVTYASDRRRTFESRRGYPTTITTDDDREARMTQLFRDGHLEQIFEGEEGRLYRVLEVSADGTRLTATSVMTGERLDAPIRITQPYVRR